MKSKEFQCGSLIREREVHLAFAVTEGKYVQPVVKSNEDDRLTNVDGFSDEVRGVYSNE